MTNNIINEPIGPDDTIPFTWDSHKLTPISPPDIPSPFPKGTNAPLDPNKLQVIDIKEINLFIEQNPPKKTTVGAVPRQPETRRLDANVLEPQAGDKMTQAVKTTQIDELPFHKQLGQELLTTPESNIEAVKGLIPGYDVYKTFEENYKNELPTLFKKLATSLAAEVIESTFENINRILTLTGLKKKGIDKLKTKIVPTNLKSVDTLNSELILRNPENISELKANAEIVIGSISKTVPSAKELSSLPIPNMNNILKDIPDDSIVRRSTLLIMKIGRMVTQENYGDDLTIGFLNQALSNLHAILENTNNINFYNLEETYQKYLQKTQKQISRIEKAPFDMKHLKNYNDAQLPDIVDSIYKVMIAINDKTTFKLSQTLDCDAKKTPLSDILNYGFEPIQANSLIVFLLCKKIKQNQNPAKTPLLIQYLETTIKNLYTEPNKAKLQQMDFKLL